MKKYIIALVAIIVLVALFFAFNGYIYKQKQGNGLPTDPYRGTLSGVQTCLPHKDTKGPQTMECAIGMKTDSGEFYALDFSMMSQSPVPPQEISSGKRFTANGLITPIENLSSNNWQKYNVKGIFSVTDSIVVDGTASSSASGTSPAATTTKPGTKPTGQPTGIVASGASGKLPAGSTPPSDPALLKANVWVWETALIGGDAAVGPSTPDRFTLTFGDNGQVSGGTDCNGFGGNYKVGSDGVITFDSFISTLMFCEGSNEGTYTGLLQEMHSFRITNGKLVLANSGGATTMTFKKK